MNNIIEKHIIKTQKRFKKYCNLILKSKYDRVITEELIQRYIDARYYNFEVDESIKVFYRRIFDSIKKRSLELIKEEPSKKEIIDYTTDLFQYFFYFDFVRNNMEADLVINKIADMRATRLNIKSAETADFIQGFAKLIEEDTLEVQENIDKYYSDDFELDIKKVSSSNKEFYRVKLVYNFEFPKIFSQEAIDEVYNTDIIGEDRLFVEYPMVVNTTLIDILNGVFDKYYIVDFSVDLLKKKQKLEQILQVLDNQAAQDKIIFEITFDDFKDNKSEVFKLIKRGFGFALKTSFDTPKFTLDELKILDIFDCIIVDPEDVNKGKYKKKKVIEI
ncbi:MAG: hypothetical protein IKJ36_03355 [Clostridia bacterium]|nr:hypothetical protein [Clostridia bacterium]